MLGQGASNINYSTVVFNFVVCRFSQQVPSTNYDEFESYYKITREKKLINICCVGSGVKYHSLSYWSIVMTSPIEFSTNELRAKQV